METLIAASIAYVTVENLFTAHLYPWRPILVFAFGLLHGLEFAGVLEEIGLPDRHFVVALVASDVGVEVAQVAVIALCFLAVGVTLRRPWYRPAIVVPASVAITAMAVYWMAERRAGLTGPQARWLRRRDSQSGSISGTEDRRSSV